MQPVWQYFFWLKLSFSIVKSSIKYKIIFLFLVSVFIND